MTSVTAATLIEDALLDLGVLAAGQTLGANDLTLGLRRLNAMLSKWRTERLTIPVVTRSVYNLVDGTASYTIGSGGTFNQDRPETIEAASIILDPTLDPVVEQPIGGSITPESWAGLTAKDVGGVPSRLYYERLYTASLGRINLYPVPDSSTYDLVIYTPTPLAAFADGDTSYVLPSGYEEAIVANLAVRLAPAFGASPSADLRARATASLNGVKHANATVPELGFDPSMVGRARHAFDIYAGR